jgi:hypothetical protein
MLPRRSARVAAEAERASGAFGVLPPALTLHILCLLPVDARLLAAAVCRGWRAALADRGLWTRLDVSHASGVTRVVRDALLHAAAARAQGTLRSLDVTGCARADLSDAAVLAVARANARTLTELQLRKTGDLVATPTLEDWNEAAPRLTCLGIDARCPTSLATALLRNEGVTYAAIRIRALTLDDLFDGSNEAEVVAVCGAVAAHTSVRELSLRSFRAAGGLSPTALNALVDAASALRLRALRLARCALGGEGGAALARALRDCGPHLTALALKDCVTPQGSPLDAPGGAALCAALRANSTLARLALVRSGLFRGDGAGGVALLRACVGHASLAALDVAGNEAPAGARAAVGAALAALLAAAGAPALTALDVSCCALRDEGLRPLLGALRASGALRELDVRGNRLSARAARAALEPAAARCGALRALRAGGHAQECEATRRAEALVAARGDRGDDA